MVPFKPYTATILAVSQTLQSDKTLGNVHKPGSTLTASVYIEQVNPSEAYMRYGVDLKNPAFLQCELADASKFTPDAEVTIGTRVYRVVGQPEIHDAGNDADHADVMLEFKQFVLTV